MKILVLGDCASAGTNVLTQEITGIKDATIEVSLTWGGKHLKEMNAWYLKETKNSREKITSVVQLYHMAMDYLHEQEKKASYWQYIGHPVTNASKGGSTAGSYYKRLIKYEQVNGKPDLIFVTDHSQNHSSQVINFNSTQYFLEKQYDPKVTGSVVNNKLKSPEIVQRMAYEKAKSNFENGTTMKRNKRMMSWFLRYLDTHDYQYKKIKFYSDFQEFYDNDTIDCSDLTSKYSTPKGDRVDIKIAVAPVIAERIKKNWPVDK
tara:strand:- start:201 stop:986 length:786 start_codon:yes stop_codon:yes gene_type:complete